MSPLQHFLRQRSGRSVVVREKILACCGWMPESVRASGRRWLLQWPLRHMRSIPAGIELIPLENGAWRVMSGKSHVADSVGLSEWIGGIDGPLSIVATGPSARDYPWDQIQSGERRILGVNGAPSFLKEVGVKADSWVISDHTFLPTAARHFANAGGVPLALTIPAAAWLARNAPSELAGRRVTLLERVNQWHRIPSLPNTELLKLNRSSGNPFVFPEGEDTKSKVGWSHFPDLGIFSGCTVVFAALQIAVGLGAKDIEIIGMDLSDMGRVYDEGDAPQPSGLSEQYDRYILPAFELMRDALEGSDVRIRNVSKVCRLPPLF